MNVKLKLIILLLLYLVLNQATPLIKTPAYDGKGSGKCYKCPPGWGVKRKCTVYKNTLCQQCEFGESYSSHYSHKSPCFSCSRCGVGLYEAHRCSPWKDTICDECISIIGRKNYLQKNDFSEKCSYLFLKNK